jgi:hypothetical protein
MGGSKSRNHLRYKWKSRIGNPFCSLRGSIYTRPSWKKDIREYPVRTTRCFVLFITNMF